jgi:hypothetical protein
MTTNSRDSIASKIEMLPINTVNRTLAHANFAAAEAWIASIAGVVASLRAFVGTSNRGIALRR